MEQSQPKSTDERVEVIRHLMRGKGATTSAFSNLSSTQIDLFNVRTAEELEALIKQILTASSLYNPQLSALQNALGLGSITALTLMNRRDLYLKSSPVGSLRTVIRHEAKGVDELLKLIDIKPLLETPKRARRDGSTVKELKRQLADLSQDNFELQNEVKRLRTIISNATEVLSAE